MESKLTVVLPVKDRWDFTLRFLRHANQLILPYHFIIADGSEKYRGTDNCITFPNLSIEYQRHRPDFNLGCYYDKMLIAFDAVKTPYVMLADDDDFLCREGLDHAVRFLDANADHVCAGGQVLGFSVLGGCYGRLHRRYRYYTGCSAVDGSIAERVRLSGLRLWIYYSVHRTEVMKQIHKEIAEINPDLMLYEAFHVMRALSMGKAHFDNGSVSYMRQFGTSTSAGKYKPWTYEGAAYDKMRRIFDAQNYATGGAFENQLKAKAHQYNSANQTLKSRLARQFPLIAAKWRNRKRSSEWRRAGLGPATAQAEREFAFIADFLKPSSGRIAAVKHDHHHFSQEIVP